MGPVTYAYEELLTIKESAAVPEQLLRKLREEADALILQPTLNVARRKIHGPTGDIHDYMSVGRYWWPNPDTADGLPYVNRDGYVNPDTQDENMMGFLAKRIHMLALAAFYFDDEKYADYVQRQLYDWFLNPDTYMKPHARYAQAIPGISDGRAPGIIDFAEITGLLDGIGVLETMGCLKPETIRGVRSWLSQFIDWVITHEIGLEEDNAQNNHGVWYDALVLSVAAFTDRKQLAKKICTTSYDRRVKTQIAEDGSQPHELARTKGLNYSLYNLEAFSIIAGVAERLGYERYWQADEQRGNCILKQAVDFLYPYVVDPDSFPYQELHPENAANRMAQMLLRVYARYPDDAYVKKAAALMDDSMLWRLAPVK